MKDNNNNGLKNHYTIIIIGSGIAGLSMCLHLLNKIPDFIGKIAVVEPKSTKRNYYLQQEYKCNEGTSEVSDDSFFENNIPQFHYPKKLQETNSINDFFTSRDSINNKSKREKDLLKMVIEKGVAYYIGSILNVNLTNGDEIKTIELQIPTSTKDSYPDQASLNFIEITSHYLIDAYGILDNNRTNEVINEPKELQTLKHDNAWLRLNSTDDTCSFRFYTNYFQGNGYWIWCEPTEKEYTIGISYDKSIIHASSINTIESFLSFLKNNCTIVYNLIKSGEIIDFNKHTKKVHKSSTKKSSDNWCILNESITTINDQFYSNSMVLMAYNIEMICKLLHLKLIVNNEKEYKTRILLYNIGIKTVVNSFNIGFKDTQDTNTLSIMKSWKIYYETTIYFNFMFPIYFNCHSLFKQLFNVYDNSLSCHNELLSLLKVANDKKLIPTTKTSNHIVKLQTDT